MGTVVANVVLDQLNELDLTEHNLLLASVLIKTFADFNIFMDDFWTSNDNQFLSLVKYRNMLLQKQESDYEVFICEYKLNKKDALEKLFLHNVDECDIDRLETRIHNGKTTLEYIFEGHKSNKKEKLANFLR